MSIWLKWLPRAGFLTLPGAWLRLVFVLAVFALLVAPLGFQRFGWPGAWAVAISAGVCGLGGMLALAVTAWSRRMSSGPQGALWAMLGGMVFRMFLPLGAGVALGRVPELQGAGIFGLIVVFYLLTLVVETWLAFALAGPGGDLASSGAPGGDLSGTADPARGGL